MAKVTVFNRKLRLPAGAGSLDLAIRESICLRSRLQLAILCADFFDAADDFLFSSGSKGQFTEDSNYLKAMRELRTKQSLFEEAFLNITASTLFSTGINPDNREAESARHLIDRHAEIYQMLEVDLALQAMQRKAEKCYAPFSQQIDALLERIVVPGQKTTLRFELVASSMWAFGEAQRVLALPLDIRLVFMKLFERHFLLKLENQFLDVINIVKHALVKGAVDERFLAASQLRSGHKAHARIESASSAEPGAFSVPAGSPSQSIELAVDTAITGQCAQPGLPAFVADMLRCKWRTVLFLIGMHRGCFGLEWRESVAAMQLLVDGASGKTLVDELALAQMLEQLRSGFALLQMPAPEQAAFERQLREHLLQQSANRSSEPAQFWSDEQSEYVAEASVSPSGKKILNRSDLEEITNLLGAESADISRSSMERQLMDCLPEIDRLQKDVAVEYKIDGNFQACSLQKNPAKPGMFNITDCSAKTTITRSRLGLAISLHEGELKLPDVQEKAAAAQKTIIESVSNKSIL